jgi:hypothetical protein
VVGVSSLGFGEAFRVRGQIETASAGYKFIRLVIQICITVICDE